MENNELHLPELEKLSKLISALRDYALKSARDQWAKNTSIAYLAPRLDSWDTFVWFELAKDWEVVNYLLSDTTRARKLMRSLHYCLQWYGQNEIDRLQCMKFSIGKHKNKIL
ncbi:MAG TPA: hypothetical protein VEM40_11170 [Nitrospirota bacterium]|nr:hypothetical protein [Nitrospirota bacterium]